MSTTIDQRVVEMRFDNRNFENNVATTMSTLEKLKQKLHLPGSTKGFDSANTAVAGLGGAVETVRAKFSALEVMGVTALANITNSAVNAGKRIAMALTIDPIKTGLQEYETQIGAIQTILANTQSKGSTLTDVNNALDELNTYADKTIYNFTEMTRNIGTFTAAGVDLDKSVTSIKGIANLAAVSGSTSAQASTAMYQLSQALAAGRVSLMDWNSVVNAGMGGQLFQDALKRTATQMGTNVDALIEKYGSFRESLTQGEWLTAEVLTETLTQLSGAYSKADLIAQGYTEKQAEEIVKLADTAVSAATEVKTVTQLWDTLKESVQSGWTQTWELLIGDFEEAKELWSSVYQTLDVYIQKFSESRNKMLEGWKDLGGRSELLEGLKNIFEGLVSVIKPIGQAFRDIFPATTSQQLYDLTVKFREFTEKLTLSDEASANLRSTFKGLFAVADIVLTVIKEIAGGAATLVGKLFGLGDSVLKASGSFGDFLSNLRDTVKQSTFVSDAVNEIIGYLSRVMDKIRDVGYTIKENFDIASLFGAFKASLQSVWDIVQSVGRAIGDVFSSIGDALAGAFGGSYLDNIMNTGMFGMLLLGLKNFKDSVLDTVEELNVLDTLKGILDNVKGTLDDVRETLQTYQENLKADILKKIAIAIGILAAAIFLISTVDPGKLAKSLGAVGVLIGELMGGLALFGMVGAPTLLGVTKSIPLMISMATAVLILSAALKNISSLDWEGIAKGLVGVGALMAELSLFLHTAKFDGKIASTAAGLVILGAALLVMSKSVEAFSTMKWEEIGKGLAGVGGLLAELALFTKLTGNATHMMSTAAGMLILGAAIKVLASAVKDFAGMQWEELGRGLAGMAGALTAVTLAMRLMPPNMVTMGTGLVIAAAALKVMADALGDFGGMSWTEIAKGLVAMGGALAELAIGLRVMQGAIAGAAALIIAAGALAILTPVLTTLGGMSWESIAKGLVAIAGAFAVIGVAGLVLAPIVPAILGLAGALALLGVSALAIGAGLALAGVGLTAIGAGAAAAATGIVAAISVIITGILNMMPKIIEILKETLLGLCNVVAEVAPQIVESLMILVTEILNSLAEYAPQIVEGLANFLINVLRALGEKLPELIQVAVEVIGQFFQGVIDALGQFSFEELVKTILGIGLMAALMAALSAVVGMIPGAMAGVLGMGLVIAELAIVLAAVGALAQIPGLKWLIGEGGDLLQQLGTAIGQFVGGLIGGIAEGATSTLPQVGKNLSGFMDNVQPFIDGAKNIDPGMMEGLKSLCAAILMLTAADILNGISKWVNGGDSMVEFAQQLAPFGNALLKYSNAVTGVNAELVAKSADAALSLVKMADQIPNEGGLWSLIAGDNSLADFANQMVPFGKGLAKYSEAVATVNPELVSKSAKAGLALVKMAEQIPNEGGLWGLIAGDNSLGDFTKQMVPFGEGLADYSEAVAKVNPQAIMVSCTAGRQLISFTNAISDNGALDGAALSSFRTQIGPLGTALAAYSNSAALINVGAINSSVSAIKKLVEAVNSLAKTNAAGVATFKRALNDLATVSIDKVVSAFNGASGKLNNVGQNLVDDIAQGVRSRIPTIKTALDNMVTTMLNTVRAKQSQFQKSATEIMQKFVSGIEKNKHRPKVIIIEALSMALAGTRTQYVGFYNAGTYIMQGLEQGIKDKANSVAQAAAKAATAALAAAKAAVGSNSPAKRFIELGMYMDQGLANGLRDYAYLANNASTNLGNSVLKSIQNRLGIKSPSVVFKEEVGRYVVEGIAEGITSDTSAEQAAQQKANNIVSAFKTAFDAIDLSQTTLRLNQELALALNPNMGDVGKSTLELQYLNNQLPNLEKKLKLAEDEYYATLEEFGEDSDYTTEAHNKYIQAQIDLANLRNEIIEAEKSVVEAQNSLDQNIANLERQLAAASGGNSGEVAQATNELNNLTSQLPGLVEKATQAEEEYLKVIEMNGANSEEAKIAYEAYLQSQVDIVELNEQITEAQKNVTEAQKNYAEQQEEIAAGKKTAWDEYIRLLNENPNLMEDMKRMGYTEDQVYQWAKERSGYDMYDQPSALADSATQSLQPVADAFEEAGNATLGTITTAFGQFGESYTQAVGDGVTSEIPGATKAVKTMGESCVGALKNTQPDWYKAGVYLVEGFAQGMTDTAQLAVDAAVEMALAALEKAQEILDIHSPSKAFYRIGAFSGEGFANALRDYIGESGKAGSEMAESARSGLQNAIAKINDSINNELDCQPTIRPVLDLSDIQNGANSIGGLFTRQSLALAGANVGYSSNTSRFNDAISQMQRSNESSNSDVVSAITTLRGDFASLISAINNMQIRMDSGAVVGELIGRIDNSLGQIATYKGRGN